MEAAMWALVLLFGCGDTRPETVVVDYVERIEVNRVCNDSGQLVFRQIIFWGWYGAKWHVVDWRMWPDPRHVDCVSGQYRARWHDNGVLREVRSPSYGETCGVGIDVEVADRERLAIEGRRKLQRNIDRNGSNMRK
jgi:hypothetical protein